MKKTRVLVVDDSALMRKYIKRILEEDPRLEVVDAARDGELGQRRGPISRDPFCGGNHSEPSAVCE
ncbi:hypothetical protein [Thermacetogenium phaeum]|uniref:hypothetical protein n=1 Tax=Thermacetogenium phaeum TaxID=85874 RepID=UPI00130DDBDF|nr:hypothetical protein [Thermacetogenium phaeum]